MSFHNSDEGEILRLFESEPQKAMSVIFEKHYDRLCLVAIRVVKDGTAAEDIVQEVFCELWKKRNELNITSSLFGYLKRSVFNKSLNYIKKKNIFSEEEPEEYQTISNEALSDEVLAATELEKAMNLAIDNLPEKARIPFCLNRYEEMTYPEIAEKLGVSVKTVEYQMSKALQILRKAAEPFLSLALLLSNFFYNFF
ncbi:MAG: RNA polymerase sigma-70 factor [Saprospiraceae bacterium]